MKTVFVRDLQQMDSSDDATLHGWLKTKRDHGSIIFMDICDSTGTIQTVIEKERVGEEDFDLAESLTPESALTVTGSLVVNGSNREILVKSVILVGLATLNMFPQPRGEIDIFDQSLQPQLMYHRDQFIRNEKMIAILRFRHLMMGFVHDWFRENGYIEITAPTLTTTPLYEDGSALSLDIKGQHVFLTQCVGFYLEAAVHAFERVYNMGPSFRGEESRSKRHLIEYWHIKAEIAWANFEDIVMIVESIISSVVKRCQESSQVQECLETLGTELNTHGLGVPFQRITYNGAVEMLNSRGMDFEYGKSFGSDEESLLSEGMEGPFWITGIPRSIEPFPYVIDERDNRLTMTADLIASDGYGELLGVAEKIHDVAMLEERMREKGKWNVDEYEWLIELRKSGCVPHVGFGMGVERLIRWLIRIEHVRDAMPFFRTFGRRIYP